MPVVIGDANNITETEHRQEQSRRGFSAEYTCKNRNYRHSGAAEPGFGDADEDAADYCEYPLGGSKVERLEDFYHNSLRTATNILKRL